MITLLTNGNKKKMNCPFCNAALQWNTSDEQEICGTRVFTCPDCGKPIIVPKTELKPKFEEELQVEYTKNIYPTSDSGEGSDDGDVQSHTFRIAWDEEQEKFVSDTTFEELQGKEQIFFIGIETDLDPVIERTSLNSEQLFTKIHDDGNKFLQQTVIIDQFNNIAISRPYTYGPSETLYYDSNTHTVNLPYSILFEEDPVTYININNSLYRVFMSNIGTSQEVIYLYVTQYTGNSINIGSITINSQGEATLGEEITYYGDSNGK